jgi:predicted dehydrogenase
MTVTGEVWGILGSGFGLYGYLPAVAKRTGGKIHTLERYRETIRKRKDIKDYENRIMFEKDANAIFARCNAVIVALRPADQELLLAEILNLKWRGRLVLEKPLARTPELALALLERLAGSGIVYRIGFTLGTTAWFAQLTEYLAAHKRETISLDFQWRFLAHHYRCDVDTWKRYGAQGGGATRFYAIHLMALFAKLGMDIPVSYRRVTTVLGEEPECSFAVSSGTWNAVAVCDSRWHGKPNFSVRAMVGGRVGFEIDLEDPFRETGQDSGCIPGDQTDTRVRYLLQILDSLDEEAKAEGAGNLAHVRLWGQLERKAVSQDSNLSA